MTRNKKIISRRSLFNKLGFGVIATTALTSCKLTDFNFFSKSVNPQTPVGNSVDLLIDVTGEMTEMAGALERAKKSVAKLNLEKEFKDWISDQQLQKVLNDHKVWLRAYYKKNYTADEIDELMKIFNSDIWKKMIRLNDLNKNAEELQKKPVQKYVSSLNENLRKVRQKKAT